MTPTQRTLKVLRDRGYLCAIVEKWNPHVNIRQDLYGIIDILAISADYTLGVQCCSSARHADHRVKILEEPRTVAWLDCPSRDLQLWSWRPVKKKIGGKRIKWLQRIEFFALNEDGEAVSTGEVRYRGEGEKGAEDVSHPERPDDSLAGGRGRPQRRPERGAAAEEACAEEGGPS